MLKSCCWKPVPERTGISCNAVVVYPLIYISTPSREPGLVKQIEGGMVEGGWGTMGKEVPETVRETQLRYCLTPVIQRLAR